MAEIPSQPVAHSGKFTLERSYTSTRLLKSLQNLEQELAHFQELITFIQSIAKEGPTSKEFNAIFVDGHAKTTCKEISDHLLSLLKPMRDMYVSLDDNERRSCERKQMWFFSEDVFYAVFQELKNSEIVFLECSKLVERFPKESPEKIPRYQVFLIEKLDHALVLLQYLHQEVQYLIGRLELKHV
jgi:hypothetical protein